MDPAAPLHSCGGANSLTAEALGRARDGVTSIEEARSLKWA